MSSSSQGSVWALFRNIRFAGGCAGALIWANINYDSYHHLVDMVLIDHFSLVICMTGTAP